METCWKQTGHRHQSVGDLFAYEADLVAWDEMLEEAGRPRRHYEPLYDALQAFSAQDMVDRASRRDRSFRDQGITFSLSGEERPFPLDLVPRVIDAQQWQLIERGVAQRVRALEAFLADVYGEGRIMADRIVPRRLVTSSSSFQRVAVGVEPANGVRVQVAGIDLVRGGEGKLYVLEDNLRTPSGISYVIENRRAMTQVLPELFTTQAIRPVDAYPARLLGALEAAAPAGIADPTVVVLTPGRYNSAYFEHTFLARQMGVELVEGRDLVCKDRTVYMRTTDGERRVDVIYRRVDDEYLDPLHFRPDSVLGCPGVLNAARAGRVTLANAVGNGVADDKAIYPYVPAMIEYYLGEHALLDNVPTLCLEREGDMEEALDRLEEMVFKPVDGSGGHGLVIGPRADAAELEELRRAIVAEPRRWIAQEVIPLSTGPTWVDDALRPRHLDLRPFAVNDGNEVWVVPGGLTRVALPEGSLVVNSSQGGGSKDTWVIGRHRLEAQGEGQAGVGPALGYGLSRRPTDPPVVGGDSLRSDQQQQQQQGRPGRAEVDTAC